MQHILIIDDDIELTDLLKELLSFENFTISVAHNGEEGLDRIDDTIDMVLLDVMMPKLNGIDTLRRLRESSDLPVLMLTAKGEEIDRVVGLELGADDYLPKPFSERELLARIRAILRRAPNTETNRAENSKAESNAPDSRNYFDLTLYPGRVEAYCGDALLDLTSTEFALLQHFIEHPGSILTKEALSLDVLGKRLAPFDRAIDMHVSNLRKKLPEWSNGKPRIKTLRGRGYLLVEGE
ncbi:response regulator [Marinomonas mediterranea]|jgi:Response regulators consisting of a CheY-like receiver domain and a winged-helix DNA-binding domain|uniref:Two component transcriptional regulator, winged helix family n=1 Tax=Marinomonas mediterranea (strain ATCC 700492 / JCM 21426 / NBRC 103028 / MMB-1) TaxID=717774 RepID=F2K301_MARM1|nr:response regulator [Marinomonas mediterranea]ADZ92390.1 two component transcriptional regulator, winged helix family [Marinomonas mediterranea MMB-1]WCN14388.1 response regulator [Marinomonas mediterranea]WCN18440.1 response regulator [Marinomonas mediterranea MMB-1]